MKIRIMVLLVLLAAVIVSAGMGTLSMFHSSAVFGTAITVDTQFVKEQKLNDRGVQPEAEGSAVRESE